MAGAGHQFLAGAGFAMHQQRRIQGRHAQAAGFEGADDRRLTEQCIEAFGAVVPQRRQALTHAVRRIQREQATGLGDRCGVEQQALAIELHFAHGQVEVVVQQGLEQVVVAEQLAHRAAGRFAPAQGDQCRVGQQHLAGAVHGQHRITHGRQQGVELQVTALAGQNVDHLHRLHAVDLEQRIVQFFEHGRAQGRCVDVDIGRNHLHRIEVEVTGTEQGQDFLGDTDAVDEADVDAHGGERSWDERQQYASRCLARPHERCMVGAGVTANVQA